MLTFADALRELPVRPYAVMLGGYDPSAAANNLTDKSGNGRHGDTSSTTSIVSGPPGIGKAQHFNPGDSGTFPMAPFPNVSFSSAAQVAWVRANYTAVGGTPPMVGGPFQYLLNYWNRSADGKITMYWGASNESEALVSTGDPKWGDGRWHMHAWVYEDNFGTDRMLYYLDGRLDSVRNRAGAAPLGGAWNMNINATPAGGIDVTGLVSWAEGTNALHQLAPARIRRLYLAGMGLLDA